MSALSWKSKTTATLWCSVVWMVWGGYPMGTQEPVLSLISGGFDSTVSSFLTARRGMNTHFCFFNLGGHAHELAVKEVAYYLWRQVQRVAPGSVYHHSL